MVYEIYKSIILITEAFHRNKHFSDNDHTKHLDDYDVYQGIVGKSSHTYSNMVYMYNKSNIKCSTCCWSPKT